MNPERKRLRRFLRNWKAFEWKEKIVRVTGKAWSEPRLGGKNGLQALEKTSSIFDLQYFAGMYGVQL